MEKKVTINGPTEALKLGISMIQQELTPIPYRNVIDNIWAGRFEKKGIIVDEAKMKKKTEELLADLELNIPATALAKRSVSFTVAGCRNSKGCFLRCKDYHYG